jgi:hypothetical protein
MMHRNRFPITVIAALAILSPGAVRAQKATGPPCGDRKIIVRNLHHSFGEILVGYGLSNAGTIIEIYAGRAGTWTMISTGPDRMTCIVATGEGWETTDASARITAD